MLVQLDGAHSGRPKASLDTAAALEAAATLDATSDPRLLAINGRAGTTAAVHGAAPPVLFAPDGAAALMIIASPALPSQR